MPPHDSHEVSADHGFRGTNNTEHLQALDNAHHLHPFTVHHELHAQKPRVSANGKGIYLWDTDGNKIIDGMAGL